MDNGYQVGFAVARNVGDLHLSRLDYLRLRPGFPVGLVFECLESHRRDGFARRIEGQYFDMIMFVFDQYDIGQFVAVYIARCKLP